MFVLGRAPKVMAREKAPQGGAHPTAWFAEFVGTGAVLFVGVNSICLLLGPSTDALGLSHAIRLLLVGLIFGAVAALFSLTPLGRRSGAHLNPVITLAFWALKKVHWHDVVAYVSVQFLASVIGTELAALLWGRQTASAVYYGATRPGLDVGSWGAVAVEAAMTAVLVSTILFMVSSAVMARFVPAAVVVLVTVFVWQVAPLTGASLNPARSFGPALLAGLMNAYWVYVLGPVAGGAFAVAAYKLVPRVEVLTTKLFHDPEYPTTMASTLAVDAR
jgi:aquaporin Z